MSATQASPAHQDCHSSSKWNQKRHCYFLFLLIVVIAAFTHNLSASQASEQDYSAQDYQKAQQSYEKAAADGNAEAMFNLGVLHIKGQGVTQDYGQARQWYEKAAAAGNAGAMASLGALYAEGQGVKQDYQLARVPSKSHSNEPENKGIIAASTVAKGRGDRAGTGHT